MDIKDCHIPLQKLLKEDLIFYKVDTKSMEELPPVLTVESKHLKSFSKSFAVTFLRDCRVKKCDKNYVNIRWREFCRNNTDLKEIKEVYCKKFKNEGGKCEMFLRKKLSRDPINCRNCNRKDPKKKLMSTAIKIPSIGTINSPSLDRKKAGLTVTENPSSLIKIKSHMQYHYFESVIHSSSEICKKSSHSKKKMILNPNVVAKMNTPRRKQYYSTTAVTIKTFHNKEAVNTNSAAKISSLESQQQYHYIGNCVSLSSVVPKNSARSKETTFVAKMKRVETGQCSAESFKLRKRSKILKEIPNSDNSIECGLLDFVTEFAILDILYPRSTDFIDERRKKLAEFKSSITSHRMKRIIPLKILSFESFANEIMKRSIYFRRVNT